MDIIKDLRVQLHSKQHFHAHLDYFVIHVREDAGAVTYFFYP